MKKVIVVRAVKELDLGSRKEFLDDRANRIRFCRWCIALNYFAILVDEKL